MDERTAARRLRSHVALETTEPVTIGSGFVSGLLGAVLGIAGFGLVVCLRFPQYLTFDELRALYALPYLRVIVHGMLVASFLLGTVSAVLRANKALALTGLGFTLAAALLGGSQVTADAAPGRGVGLGVDFFVLSLIVYSGIFIPLERRFALRGDQPVFRRHWLLDLTYFFCNTLLVEILTILTLRPALILFEGVRLDGFNPAGGLMLLVEVPMILVVADFTQYWVHRAFHVLPALWRFHAIHHSVETMDWLAGSRLHLVDVVVTRGLVYVPIFVLGFSEQALVAYVFLVAAQATFIHANVRWEFRLLRKLVATPVFHHWHHSAEPEAVDTNFSVHLPFWDLIFGTYYVPDRWPARYGLHAPADLPMRWTRQFIHPFRGTR